MKRRRIGKYNQIENVEVSSVFGNLTQEVIQITSDRLKLLLQRHLDLVRSRTEWVAPAGILATLLVVFPTTTFGDWIFPAATWKAFFVILAILVFAWLVISIFRIRRAQTVDDLVDKIKQSE